MSAKQTPIPEQSPVPEDAQESVGAQETVPDAVDVPEEAEAVTVGTLVDAYVTLSTAETKFTAFSRWNWARSLDGLMESLSDPKARTATSVEIGKNIAEGLARPKPYSGSWVRQHAAAYRQFALGLNSQEDCRAFLDAVNGNTKKAEPVSKTDGTTGGTDETDGDTNSAPSTPDPLARLERLIHRLMRDGFSSTDILDRTTLAVQRFTK